MPAVESSLSLVELVQALREQQEQYAQATEAVSQTLADQLRQQQEAAAGIAATLEHLGSLLSALLGGLTLMTPRPTPPAVATAAEAPAGKPAGSVAAKAGTAAKPPARAGNKFPVTGIESVLRFVEQKQSPTTQELAAHWQSEGRGGKVDHTLSQLVKDKVLKRVTNPEGRGSRYVLA